MRPLNWEDATASSVNRSYPFSQVGAAPSLSELAVTKVASMSMTSHPVSVFPAMTSHGNPAGVSSISFHACARAFARARAIRSSATFLKGCI